MDLFEYVAESKKEKEAPLAARMRPQTLDDRPVWEKQPLRA